MAVMRIVNGTFHAINLAVIFVVNLFGNEADHRCR